MSLSLDELKAQIEEAFSNVPYPGDGQIAYSETAWECPEINEDFKGKHWRDVPRETIRWHRAELPLFSPSGFQYYLPAYLLAALIDLEVRGFLLSTLEARPEREPVMRERFERLTPSQKNAVKAFLEFMRAEAKDDITWEFWSRPLRGYWGRDWE
jgi:hypothetical protein